MSRCAAGSSGNPSGGCTAGKGHTPLGRWPANVSAHAHAWLPRSASPVSAMCVRGWGEGVCPPPGLAGRRGALVSQWVSDGVGIPIMSPADESSCTAMVLDFRPTNQAPQYGYRSSKEAGGSGRNRLKPCAGTAFGCTAFPVASIRAASWRCRDRLRQGMYRRAR